MVWWIATSQQCLSSDPCLISEYSILRVCLKRWTKHLSWKAVGEDTRCFCLQTYFHGLFPWPVSCSSCTPAAVQHGAGHGGCWAITLGCTSSWAEVAGVVLCCWGSHSDFVHCLALSCVSGLLCIYNSLEAFPGGTVVCKHICVTVELIQAAQVINSPFCTDDCFVFYTSLLTKCSVFLKLGSCGFVRVVRKYKQLECHGVHHVSCMW